MQQEKEKSIEFWNQCFQEIKPFRLQKTEVKIENSLDKYLQVIGDSCETVLDVGCGLGMCLMTSLYLGSKMKKGIGFDASVHAISFAQATSQLSGFSELTFVAQDESFMEMLSNESIDGMICSNFLDVIPENISKRIIVNMKRALKSNGLLLIKFNFYLDDDLIKRLNMEKIDDNTYTMNGVIRAFNLTTEQWIERFEGFDLIEKSSYQRAPNLPEDRILLFKKKSKGQSPQRD